jgi:hypothetical protein
MWIILLPIRLQIGLPTWGICCRGGLLTVAQELKEITKEINKQKRNSFLICLETNYFLQNFNNFCKL